MSRTNRIFPCPFILPLLFESLHFTSLPSSSLHFHFLFSFSSFASSMLPSFFSLFRFPLYSFFHSLPIFFLSSFFSFSFFSCPLYSIIHYSSLSLAPFALFLLSFLFPSTLDSFFFLSRFYFPSSHPFPLLHHLLPFLSFTQTSFLPPFPT